MPQIASRDATIAQVLHSLGERDASIASSKEDPNEINVEIYGIVYIYNPPDRKLLGLPEAAQPATPPVAPIATPASTNPTRPATEAGATAGR